MSLAYAPGAQQGVSSQFKQQHSQSPEPGNDDSSQAKHRRNYQACERCRERKVKCDLGSVDAPRKPPCARCMREQKKCEFANQRKKRKSSADLDDNDGSEANEDIKRRRTISSNSRAPEIAPFTSQYGNGYGQAQLDEMLDVGSTRPQPIQSIEQPSSYYNSAGPPRMEQRDPRRAMPLHVGQLASNNDRNSYEIKSQAAEGIMGNPDPTTSATLGALASAAALVRPAQPLDLSEITGGPKVRSESPTSPDEKRDRAHALDIWGKMRLVKVGFLTAQEAMRYVEYFYSELQPMTPVVVRQYRQPSNHGALLTQEPVLALTILAIASRYMNLTGHAAKSRSYAIHAQLWDSLRSKIQRLLWGQEQFGGGFTGAGSAKLRETAPGQLTWPGSLRTFGTVEALLLLTDWQPRALHFPPGDDDPRLLDTDYDHFDDDSDRSKGKLHATDPHEATPYASWLEPAWRSDKMSWMLLGLAQSLAFELGVFDRAHAVDKARVDADPDMIRKYRLQRLVLVYVAQTSGRIGIPSPLVLAEWPSATITAGPRNPVDHMQALWVHVAGIMNKANMEIFASRDFTKQLTQGNGYHQKIAAFVPLLQAWKDHFNSVKDVLEEQMKQILLMEYEYARLYLNSLGLSNIMEKWMDQGSTSRKPTLAKAIATNKQYIDELTEAALHILDIVVNEVGGKQHLREAPIRAFLRCLSAMMFTLKRLSLGNHERMVRKSLDLLDRVVELLGQEVVDDVHLSSSTSRLVQNIVASFRQTLIRVAKPVTDSGAQSRDASRPQSPQPNGAGSNGFAEHQQFPTTLPPSAAPFMSNDSLAGIQARDMSDLQNVTFIPPPNYDFERNDFDPFSLDEMGHGTSLSDPDPADWFAMPLDNLWNRPDDQINQGSHSIGPTVGHRDMLEVLTNQDYNHMQWPNNSTQNYQHGYRNM